MGLTAAIDDLDFSLLEGRRLGLLTNSAARTASGQTTLDTLRSHPSAEINCIFTPEHGLTATAEPAQPVPDGQSAGTRVITLYGARLQPDPDHLNDIDLVVIDLPGLGVRCFTYLATAWRTIIVAAEARTPVLILDRPNSLGRSIELPIGQARAKGLLCPLTVPLRHGLTLGEILRMAATEAHIPQPDIALCAPVAEPGPPWWPPSPNLPSLECAQAYPGTVLMEGTGLSEGRGTNAPFLKIGAPTLPAGALADHLGRLDLPGLAIRSTDFTPSQSKHAGHPCQGIELSITDPEGARPVTLILHLLAWLRDNDPDSLALNDMLDALAGTDTLRRWCETANSPVEALTANWQDLTKEFENRRAPHLLYGA